MENWMEWLQTYAGLHLPAIVSFVLKVVFCIAVYIIGKRVIERLTRSVRGMLGRTKMETGAVTFTCSIAKIFLYCILVLGIAMQFGVTESSVAALVASGGVAIGLAFQGGLSNLAGGFLILVFRPFQVGDYIITQDQAGTVQKIEIMYTTLQTSDTRRVIVPNGTLADNVIVNVTAAARRKLEIKVGISYEDDLQAAKQVLERLIEENETILKDEYNVFVAELGESSVVLGLHCWVPTGEYNAVLWQMNERIKLEFDRAGLHIPYPQMDVHIVRQTEGSLAEQLRNGG